MKNIVFINPPSDIGARYGLLASAGGVEPPFGLCYLAAAARARGYDARIVDAQALALSAVETAKLVADQKPDFIGLTAATSSIKSAAEVASLVKKNVPGVIAMVGGCHLTAQPKKTMDTFPDFDIGVIGEGENTLPELLDSLRGHKDLNSIEGIVYRNNGKAVVTEKRARIQNLDSLPFPAFDLLPDIPRHYRIPVQSIDNYPAVSLVTSRGCSGKCGFCDRSVFGNEVTCHSADYTLNLMRQMKERCGIRSILFEDDNFMALLRGKRKDFIKKLTDGNLNITWACAGRVDDADEELLRSMKEAGCYQVLYGIESGSQKILDGLRKGITIEAATRALAMTKKAGIRTKGFFIAGSPGETNETLAATGELMMKADLDDISITCYTPYFGTEIYDGINRHGTLSGEISRYSQFDAVFIPRGLEREEIEKFIKNAYREFYLRPSKIIGYARRVKSPEHLKQLALAALGPLKYIFSANKNAEALDKTGAG